MLTAAGSALVSGASQSTMEKKIVSVRVLRPFLVKLTRHEVDSVIQMDIRQAQELASWNKVQILKPEPVKSEPAKVSQEGSDPTPPVKGKKGASDARQ